MIRLPGSSPLGLKPDGRDIVDGGLESLPGIGDTFVINGSALAEIYRVYSHLPAQLGGLTQRVNAGTEIVITRGGRQMPR